MSGHNGSVGSTGIYNSGPDLSKAGRQPIFSFRSRIRSWIVRNASSWSALTQAELSSGVRKAYTVYIPKPPSTQYMLPVI
jgi:hypothetical protein